MEKGKREAKQCRCELASRTVSVLVVASYIETWGQFHQHVYAQLLRVQIPKAQKAA